MPQIGLDADFRIDGLSLLFGILILGIGLLIILYVAAGMIYEGWHEISVQMAL